MGNLKFKVEEKEQIITEEPTPIVDSHYTICLVPVTAQPPTFGMILSLMSIADRYDQIVVCVQDDPILIPTEFVIKMLSVVLRLPKFIIISSDANFGILTEPPTNLPYFNRVATMSERVYANLVVKGYGCYLIPRAIGYDELFHRNAFKQSQVLELLRLKTVAVPIGYNKKTEEPTSEAGE
jgi:hypothetical protein